jgi:hypothetical protein
MKKVLVVACVIVMSAAAGANASPALDRYIQAIANLSGPNSMIPAAPKGYGAVRLEETGDYVILVPREYCGGNAPAYVMLGQTRYGSQIYAYCGEF